MSKSRALELFGKAMASPKYLALETKKQLAIWSALGLEKQALEAIAEQQQLYEAIKAKGIQKTE